MDADASTALAAAQTSVSRCMATSTTKNIETKSSAKSAKQTSRCWPGFEPVPGKAPREKGSCEPKTGKQSAAVKRADQKAAATSRLAKQGKPNPRAKK